MTWSTYAQITVKELAFSICRDLSQKTVHQLCHEPTVLLCQRARVAAQLAAACLSAAVANQLGRRVTSRLVVIVVREPKVPEADGCSHHAACVLCWGRYMLLAQRLMYCNSMASLCVGGLLGRCLVFLGFGKNLNQLVGLGLV